MRKKLHINNAQYSILEASEDFMVTALILVSGAVTDRIGGAGESSPQLSGIPSRLTNSRRHALG